MPLLVLAWQYAASAKAVYGGEPLSSSMFILKLTLMFALACSACSSRQVYMAAADTAPISTNAININTATAEELEVLPRIGPKTAQKIVEFREQHGPFRRVEHLMQIPGISEKKFLEIRPHIRVD
jgi:comEA protein